MIFLSKEERQLLKLYRKVKTPLERYRIAEFIKLNAEQETGEKYSVPDSMETLDSIYEAFCINVGLLKDVFAPEEVEQHKTELEDLMKADMEKVYQVK